MPVDLADLAKIQEELDKSGYKSKPSFLSIKYLNELKLLFEKEGNPFFAWMAYAYSRQLIKRNDDFTIPEWIYSYLDNAANELLKIGPGKGAFGKIATALGMWTQGRGTAITQAQQSHFRFLTVQMVLIAKKINPQKGDLEIFNDIAEEINEPGENEISEITIMNWYYEWRNKI